MNADLNVIRLILEASVVVQLVMGLLVVASLASWAVIFKKRSILRRSQQEADQFEANFWSGGDLSTLYRNVEQKREASGMEWIFQYGYREFGRRRQQAGNTSAAMLDGARRAMRVAQLKEMDRLEHNLAMLATIGSISPYVGLFGTVWGIMSAFHALGNVQQATLAMVAPGIAEALIATAMGLFAAIPAVIAYNKYADQVQRLEVRYDAFMEEFSTILERSAGTPRAAQQGAA
jgi:biopolymer transport protein TolQ